MNEAIIKIIISSLISLLKNSKSEFILSKKLIIYFISIAKYTINKLIKVRNTKNNKIYMTIDLKLPDGHKDWGSKDEMLKSYSARAEWTCEEK